ncbi:Uncharacterised protein [Mycobacteroides abscessus subsp. abscessus]|nr:Uncharacterised protein [Mycobacteroides abscessus subsp. abscessus]
MKYYLEYTIRPGQRGTQYTALGQIGPRKYPAGEQPVGVTRRRRTQGVRDQSVGSRIGSSGFSSTPRALADAAKPPHT